ncbi:toll/interleukin-1 receptor domain-containing protein [Sorangium sp. So ce1099]|uniref:toll/interleukin-1 receptor domain-containing protein n=1 Tax=Sorangium sp. So ce1099 TaxID=3133331 RepID=UPI003F5DC13B
MDHGQGTASAAILASSGNSAQHGRGKRGMRVSPKELLSRYEAGERDFTDTNLYGAGLPLANLSGADLSGVDLRHANLYGANLTGAKLRSAILHRADLTNADCSGADLFDARLSFANLTGTVLSGANLSYANLFNATINLTNLSNADLSSAGLAFAHISELSEAHLANAKFAGVRLADTLLVDVDLQHICEAEPPIDHEGPSVVDYRSILRSVQSPKLKDFLVRTGMPEILAEYTVDCALSLRTDIFKMLQSTFISYGAPDEPFARKLYEALHRNGVTTFFFPEHAEPGEKLHRMMRKGVNEHDRVILICSRSSLDRKGVLNELEEILTREARDGGASYLIPIRLDDYVFTGWKPTNADVAQGVRDRVVADFEGAETDQAKFQAGLQKLIRALRKKTVEAADVGKE